MISIGFDVSDVCTARADGTTHYTLELLREFSAPEFSAHWNFFAPCPAPTSTTLPSKSTWHSSPFPKYWTQLRFPFDLAKVNPDVLFMPIQQLPIMRPRKMKTVAVIHDLAFHYFPEHTLRKDWALLHLFTAQVAREADRIIAISQHTADDIAKFYGRTEGVHVVHHGVNHSFFRPASSAELTDTWKDLTEYIPSLAPNFILTVGQIQPRKNLVRLVEAYEQWRDEGGDSQLVLAGGHGWKQKEIERRVQSSKYKDSIFMPGVVPNELLRALYWHAGIFTVPSLYEGFGMPVIEAMASGAPVMVSNTSCLPEIAGNAGVLIDPSSCHAIARGITETFTRRDELIALGFSRAQDFSWIETARNTFNVVSS